MHGWHMARQREILTIAPLLSILPTLHTYPAFRTQTFPLRRTNSRAEHLIVFSPPGFPFFFLAICMDGNARATQRKAEVKRHWHSISIIGIYIFFFFLPFSRALGRYIRGSPFSSLLIPPSRDVFFPEVKRLYILERGRRGVEGGL